MSKTQTISPQQAHNEQWTIVDVRTGLERALASVPGSVHLPLQQVHLGHPVFRETTKPIALLCKSGARARAAQQQLAPHGIRTAVVEGGILRWRREGLPVHGLADGLLARLPWNRVSS